MIELYGLFLAIFLYNKINGVLYACVVLYGLTLSSMVACFSLRYGYTSKISYYTMFLGGIIFAMSDLLLACEFFLKIRTWFTELLIVITYYAA